MDKTIEDFGQQWQSFQENRGYYASTELFADIFSPLLEPAELQGKVVVDVGSGTGRIVNMILACDPEHVIAVEPSSAFEVLRRNTRADAGKITYLQLPGAELPADLNADLIVSAGVFHHIPDVDPVVTACFRALQPGGRLAVWLYGHEGNRLYLAMVRPLRELTTRLPHKLLLALCWTLWPFLALYSMACRWFPLPLREYMRGHLAKLGTKEQVLTIYDQLNPGYAKYYRRSEALALLRDGGFTDVQIHHRKGYSWTVMGTKP